jgi:cell division septation protein DedD
MRDAQRRSVVMSDSTSERSARSEALGAVQGGVSYGAGRGSSRRKVSEDRRYPGMGVGRETRGRFELRIGALQAILWVGLAVGAMVGTYFVGFFSGHYVGFDAARSSSAVEGPRLTIQEELADRKIEEGDEIYSKLDTSTGEGLSVQVGNTVASPKGDSKKDGEEPSAAAKVVMEMKSSAVVKADGGAKREAELLAGAKSAQEAKSPSAPGVSAAEIDALFDQSEQPQDTGGAATGSDKTATVIPEPIELLGEKAEPQVQKGVRVLGAARPSDEPESATAPAGSAVDTSLGAILEERVAKAREDHAREKLVRDGATNTPNDRATAKSAAVTTGAAKTVLEKSSEPTTAAGVAESKDDRSAATASTPSGMVKQVLPPGFFAQVAAPKRMTEAQDVARRLKRSGFPVVIETAHVRGEDYYRVLVGPEDNKAQADRLIDQLKRESYLSGTAFLRKVK